MNTCICRLTLKQEKEKRRSAEIYYKKQEVKKSNIVKKLKSNNFNLILEDETWN